ncbi:MAG: DNA-3-methyladenine glycosylase [Saprospiraceae bacterium]|uniref:Putative 3-methyladenine DNA glycosylase n=1 Tax=Candidatus Opimibacter skivensis TaxID=2982028 RepID=A0A9D7SSP9_9BACT|nr:DNA-3-methyladenine glycosylase [Candidatus Opimibacter skivensis]
MKPKGKKLPASYYASHDVNFLAKDLLGKFLCTHIDGIYTCGKIVETEAYRGPDDKAAHSYNNRRTPRTEVMYRKGGVAYIYFCYGIHHMMNVVTAPQDHPHAVLIRALEPAEGIDAMAERRKMEASDIRLTKGPGALCVALGLTKDRTGTSLYKTSTSIWIENRGINYDDSEICAGKRIGIDNAGDAVDWPWRYFVKGSKYVSAKRGC